MMRRVGMACALSAMVLAGCTGDGNSATPPGDEQAGGLAALGIDGIIDMALSPDGSQIAFTGVDTERHRAFLDDEADACGDSIWIGNTDGTGLERVFEGSTRLFGWSADGTQLLLYDETETEALCGGAGDCATNAKYLDLWNIETDEWTPLVEMAVEDNGRIVNASMSPDDSMFAYETADCEGGLVANAVWAAPVDWESVDDIISITESFDADSATAIGRVLAWNAEGTRVLYSSGLGPGIWSNSATVGGNEQSWEEDLENPEAISANNRRSASSFNYYDVNGEFVDPEGLQTILEAGTNEGPFPSLTGIRVAKTEDGSEVGRIHAGVVDRWVMSPSGTHVAWSAFAGDPDSFPVVLELFVSRANGSDLINLTDAWAADGGSA